MCVGGGGGGGGGVIVPYCNLRQSGVTPLIDLGSCHSVDTATWGGQLV